MRYPKAVSPFASTYSMRMMRKQIPSRKSTVCVSNCGRLLAMLTADDAALSCAIPFSEHQSDIEQIWRTMTVEHAVFNSAVNTSFSIPKDVKVPQLLLSFRPVHHLARVNCQVRSWTRSLQTYPPGKHTLGHAGRALNSRPQCH